MRIPDYNFNPPRTNWKTAKEANIQAVLRNGQYVHDIEDNIRDKTSVLFEISWEGEKMNLAYGLYMAEEEGYLNTKYSRGQAVVKECQSKSLYSRLTEEDIHNICNKHNIHISELSSAQYNEIEECL